MTQIRFHTVLASCVVLLGMLAACGGGQSPMVPTAGGAPSVTPVTGGNSSTTIDNYPISMKEFALPPLPPTLVCACPAAITVGSDGIIWFSSWATIDSIDGHGNVHVYAPPSSINGGTDSLAPAADGALWFLTSQNAQMYQPLIGRLTTNGTYTFFPPLPSSTGEGLRRMKRAPGSGVAYVGSTPYAFGHVYSTGPPGSLDFSATYNDAVPIALARGNDGLLYAAVANFGGAGCHAFFCVQALAAGRGVIRTFPLIGEPVGISQINDMVMGPDNKLWLLDSTENIIVRISTDGSGYTQFAPTPRAGLNRITVAPDGALYFTERYVSKIGRITTQGHLQEFATPTRPSGPYGIAACPQLCEGSHVRLWITESGANKILRFEY